MQPNEREVLSQDDGTVIYKVEDGSPSVSSRELEKRARIVYGQWKACLDLLSLAIPSVSDLPFIAKRL